VAELVTNHEVGQATRSAPPLRRSYFPTRRDIRGVVTAPDETSLGALASTALVAQGRVDGRGGRRLRRPSPQSRSLRRRPAKLARWYRELLRPS
jgi:hypothetical protein